jgi:hypothetical protein
MTACLAMRTVSPCHCGQQAQRLRVETERCEELARLGQALARRLHASGAVGDAELAGIASMLDSLAGDDASSEPPSGSADLVALAGPRGAFSSPYAVAEGSMDSSEHGQGTLLQPSAGVYESHGVATAANLAELCCVRAPCFVRLL